MDFRIIEYKEILHEAFAGLLADISNIISQRGITPESKDPLCVLEKQTASIWREILGNKYSSMEDMIKLKGQYEFIQSYIKGMA